MSVCQVGVHLTCQSFEDGGVTSLSPKLVEGRTGKIRPWWGRVLYRVLQNEGWVLCYTK